MTHIESVEEDVRRYKGLAALANSDGGLTLVAHMKERISSDVETICSLMKAPETELRASVAQLKADIYVYRVLLNAEQNAKIAVEELDRLLKPQSDVS